MASAALAACAMVATGHVGTALAIAKWLCYAATDGVAVAAFCWARRFRKRAANA